MSLAHGSPHIAGLSAFAAGVIARRLPAGQPATTQPGAAGGRVTGTTGGRYARAELLRDLAESIKMTAELRPEPSPIPDLTLWGADCDQIVEETDQTSKAFFDKLNEQ